MRDALRLAGLGAVVFLSRIPFLAPGYGSDPDADRIAIAARVIAATGSYSVSRFPGYPIPELVGSLLQRGGPLWMNGATAFWSALAVVAFALCLRAAGARSVLAAAGALAFTRVVYVQSTTSMDYLWALAPLLAGFWCALLGRPVLAGILVGGAAGCRPTSLLACLPCAMVAAAAHAPARAGRLDGRAALALVAASAAAAAFSWSPVPIAYGWKALSFSQPPEPMQASEILRSATWGVWGRIGAWALAAAVPVIALDAARGRLGSRLRGPLELRERAVLGAATLAVALYLALFLALPRESAYLIPAVPFAILWLERLLERRVFRAVCLAIAVSSFTSLGVVPPREGTIFFDHANRIEAERVLEDLLAWAESQPERNVLVIGPKYLARIKARLPAEALADAQTGLPPAARLHPVTRGSTTYVAQLEERAKRALLAAGIEVHTAIGKLSEGEAPD